MSGHTPGPYRKSSTHLGEAYDIEGPKGENIALVHGGANVGPGEMEGNADLFVAAPDLLEACVLEERADAARDECPDCRDQLEMAPETCARCFPHFDRARVARRAAIAKAEADQ